MSRLPLRIRPVAAEPGHGALLRLAGRHGATLLPRFAKSVGLDWRGVLAGHHVAALATLAGLDAESLRAHSPVIDSSLRTVCLNGETIRLGDWSVTKRRACLACVAEDAAIATSFGVPRDWMVAHRSFMDVRSIGRCPIHRTPLQDDCPKCGSALTWSRAPLARCPKGCDLSDAGGRGDLDVRLDAYFAGRLGTGARIDVGLLDDLPFRRAVQLVERIGRISLGGWIPRLSKRGEGEDDACRRAGFDMITEWPVSLFRALDGVLASSCAAGAGDGLIARYGWLHPDWLSVEDDEVSALARPLVREHAVRNGIVARDEPILSHDAPPTVSLSQARTASGMGFERTRRMLDEAGVVPSGSRRGVPFAMDPEAVASALSVGIEETVTRAAAGKMLGVGRSRIADLLDAGLLDRHDRRVTSRSVEALIRLVTEATSRSPAPDDAVSLVNACRGCGIPLAHAFSRIISGTLAAWAGRSRTGELDLRVLPRQLAPPRRALRRDRAAARVGIHPQCLGQLVRAGAIEVSSDGGVDSGSLDEFIDRHVAASKLAADLSSSPRALISKLAAFGVLPTYGPPRFSQAIYRRHDVERLNDES